MKAGTPAETSRKAENQIRQDTEQTYRCTQVTKSNHTHITLQSVDHETSDEISKAIC